MRKGRRNQPFFKIVVTEKQLAATKGRFVEEVGFYNPLTKERKVVGDRIKYWLSVGAQPSDTVHNLLVTEKVIESPKIPKHKKSKKPAEEKAKPAEAPASETAEQSAPTSAKEEPTDKSAAEDKPADAPTSESTEEQPTDESTSTEADEPAVEEKQEEIPPTSEEEPKKEKEAAPAPPSETPTDKPQAKEKQG